MKKIIYADQVKSYRHFIIRTVRNGRIKFDHQWWIPEESTERLNGMRFAFGVYVEGYYSHPVKRLDMLGLWGSEECYNSMPYDTEDSPEYEAYSTLADKDTELLAPDGFFRQYWWHPIEAGI